MLLRCLAFALLFPMLALGPATNVSAEEREQLPDVEVADGAYPNDAEDWRWSVRNAARLRPVSQLDADAVRFTFDAGSALRKSYVFEVRRRASDALLLIAWLDRREGGGWQVERRARLLITTWEYDGLSRLVDMQIARGRDFAARIESGEGLGRLCVDGFALLTERAVNGHQSWMSGSCGPNHPNEVIEHYLRALALDRLGG